MPKWWMNALAQRNKTLLRVADFMIRYQFEYFNNGEISLRPLGQQQIADELGYSYINGVQGNKRQVLTIAIRDNFIKHITGRASFGK